MKELEIYKSIVDENTRTVYIPHEEIKLNTVLEEGYVLCRRDFQLYTAEDLLMELI